MRKLILLLLSVPILFNSCGDDDEEPFCYTDISPDKTTTSMIPYQWTTEDIISNHISYAINENYNSIVWCAWSTSYYDMNMDSVKDFSFDVRHYFNYSVDDSPYFDELLIFIGSMSDSEVSIADATNGYIKKYALGDALDYSSFGNFPIRHDEGGYLIRVDKDHTLDDADEFYIAVKTMKDNRAYYGWFLVSTTKSPLTLTVKEYAISRIGNREIIIGQRLFIIQALVVIYLFLCHSIAISSTVFGLCRIGPTPTGEAYRLP